MPENMPSDQSTLFAMKFAISVKTVNYINVVFVFSIAYMGSLHRNAIMYLNYNYIQNHLIKLQIHCKVSFAM